MNTYTSFDYLCNEPYSIAGIGSLHCPTLREIRQLTYHTFCIYQNIISASITDFLEMYQIDNLPSTVSLYQLLLYSNPGLLNGILQFFLEDSVIFHQETESFFIYTQDDTGTQHLVGQIGNDNFELLRQEIQRLLGIKPLEEAEPKFKNNYAKNLYEKMQKNSRSQKKQHSEDYTLDNMILKFCTHNKTGINILNVWDMTYYQFIMMFHEYCNGRQCDFNDKMAANTFSYKNTSDYQPMDYMKKLSSR